MTCFMEKGN